MITWAGIWEWVKRRKTGREGEVSRFEEGWIREEERLMKISGGISMITQTNPRETGCLVLWLSILFNLIVKI